MTHDTLVKRLTASAIVLAFGAGTAVAQQSGSEQSGSPYGGSATQSERGGSQYGSAQDSSSSPSSNMEQSSSAQSGLGEPQSDQSQASAREQGSGADLDRLTEQHDDLSQFVEALQQVGLADAITSGTAYTVFAPTNDAFDQLPNADELMQPGNEEQLISTLRAHIVADDLDPERARTLGAAQTVDGGTIQITTEGDELHVGEATVVNQEIEQLGNLRIYAIDQVLESSPGSVSSAMGEQQEAEPAAGESLTGERDESQVRAQGEESRSETGGASRSSGF